MAGTSSKSASGGEPLSPIREGDERESEIPDSTPQKNTPCPPDGDDEEYLRRTGPPLQEGGLEKLEMTGKGETFVLPASSSASRHDVT